MPGYKAAFYTPPPAPRGPSPRDLLASTGLAETGDLLPARRAGREGPGEGGTEGGASRSLNTPLAEARGKGGRPQLGRASGVMWRWGLQGAGKVEGRGWGGDSPWPPLPSHAPPCYVRSSRASSESCRWGQQDAGGSRGGRLGASAAQLAGPCGACVAAGASPQPHASPCSPGSASGALPWPGGRGPPRVAPVLPGRRLDRGTLGAEGSQVSRISCDQGLLN